MKNSWFAWDAPPTSDVTVECDGGLVYEVVVIVCYCMLLLFLYCCWFCIVDDSVLLLILAFY